MKIRASLFIPLLAAATGTFFLNACGGSGVNGTAQPSLYCSTAPPITTCVGSSAGNMTNDSPAPTVGMTNTPSSTSSTAPNPVGSMPSTSSNGLPQGVSIVTINGRQAFAYNNLVLYYFNKDHDTGSYDLSHCPYNGVNNNCTQDWPPAMASANDPDAPLVTAAPGTAPAGWSQFVRGQNNANCPNCEINGVTPDQYNQLSFNGHPAYYYTDATAACGSSGDTPGTANGAGLTCDGGYSWDVLYTNTTSADGP